MFWRKGLLSVLLTFSSSGFLGVAAHVGSRNVYFVNVYSGCSVRRKRDLWSNLIREKARLSEGCWVIGGDFNTVTNRSERKGKMARFSERESQDFKFFMEEMGVVEPVSLGKKFTWFQPNGPAASRIDRILLSQDLMEEWMVRAQWIEERDISDHFPVWLVVSKKNWGPKPFKFINGWLKHEGGKEFMEDKWKEIKVEGWMAQVVKEKLKFLKESLRVWNREVYGYKDLRIEEIVKEMNVMEQEEVEEGEWDGERWKRLNKEFWSELHHKEALLAQKARVDWIQQGDDNTRFFHNSIKYRERRNHIEALRVGDEWKHEVIEIKEEVRNHFQKQFRENWHGRPTLDGVEFKKISLEEAHSLVSPFTPEEVEEAIWSCEGNKSLGPDGFNFNFIKSCWNTIKEDIMGVLSQFHINGRLPKAFTSSFVALIGKKKTLKSLGILGRSL